MALRKVASMGNPVLRKKAAPIAEKDITSSEIQTLIQDMIETMFEYDGRGLAAPQVHESIRLVVLVWDFDPKVKPHIMCLINPVLTPVGDSSSEYWEGCLSVPGLRGLVARPDRVKVQALNEKGKKISFEAEGFAATVLQHECDHLDGILYVDKLKDSKSFAFNKEFEKFLAPEDASESEGEG